MIIPPQVQTISTAAYFEYDYDRSMEELMRCHGLLMGDDSVMGIVNGVVSKKTAKRFARESYGESQGDFSELWISKDAVRIRDIKDYLGENIFTSIHPDISGWLVFFDPSTFANWEHECEYQFIVNENYREIHRHCRAPGKALAMEKI